MVPTQPLIQWLWGGTPPPQARRVGHAADGLRSLESNLKKERSYTYTSPHACLAWCLVMEREKHIFAVQMYGVNVPF